MVMRYVRCVLGMVMSVSCGIYICVATALFLRGTNQVVHETHSVVSLLGWDILFIVAAAVWLVSAPLHAVLLFWNGTPKRKFAILPLIMDVMMFVAGIYSSAGISAEHSGNSGPEDLKVENTVYLVLVGFVVQGLDLVLPPHKYLRRL